jgi:hypothetical protein
VNHLSAEELQTLLQHGRYTIEDLDTLRGVLSDAFTLYDVEAGRARLSDLLAVIEKRADPEVFSLIVFDLARFLAPRLRKILAELSELQQEHASALADSFGPILERRFTAVQAVKHRLRELWVATGTVHAADARIVEAEILRQVWKDSVAIAKVEAGDLGDVDRLFRERMSAPRGLVQ